MAEQIKTSDKMGEAPEDLGVHLDLIHGLEPEDWERVHGQLAPKGRPEFKTQSDYEMNQLIHAFEHGEGHIKPSYNEDGSGVPEGMVGFVPHHHPYATHGDWVYDFPIKIEVDDA